MLAFFEREAARKVLVSAVNFAAAWAVAHASGRFGISVDQVQLAASLFAGAEFIRHTLAIKYPGLAPWIS